MVHTPLRLVQNEHPQVNEYKSDRSDNHKSDMSDYHHSKKCRHSPLTVLSHNSMKYLASNLLLRHQRLELGLPFPRVPWACGTLFQKNTCMVINSERHRVARITHNLSI